MEGESAFSEYRLKIGRRELKALIRELKKWKAPATVLLSLYIPPGRPLSDVLSLLRQELAITDNIKLKRTRDAVKRALSAAIDRLGMLNKVPENGLVVFCGQDVNTGDFMCILFSPPDPVPVFFYRTDKWFHTEFLEDMVEERDVYGLVIIERDEATIGMLRGSSLTVVDELEGYVPGKHHKGGQSQRRFDRIIEQLVDEFFKRVGERVNEHFLPLLEQGRLKGIIVGGPGYAKVEFINGNYLDYRLKRKIIGGPIDVAYQGIAGLKELVMRASNLIKGHKYLESINVIEEFKYHLAKDDGLVAYGEAEVKKLLEMGVIDKLIILEDHPEYDKLYELAKKYGTKVYPISLELPESQWLRKTFNGIVAILRYRIY
ncbi:MAG TPA: peptide chain release factor 1 [Acidilobales archaeon]|nr:peptide chain release factor 1 [Acidilobales archaeon]